MKTFLTVILVVLALALGPAASYSKTPVGQSANKETTTSDKASQAVAKEMKFPASEIFGKGVQNDEGEYLGVIRDLMIDPQNGGISFVLLSPGGVMGIPMRFVPVPFGAMTFNPAKNVFLLDMSRQKIIAAPGFDRAEFPRQASRGWETEVYRYYGLTPPWGEAEKTKAAGHGAAYRFSELRGMSVRNQQGEKLGSIRDLVIDSKGHVSEAVISHGGFLGIGAKAVSVPLGDLKFDGESQSFVLPWTKEKLDTAPAFHERKLAGS